MICFMFSSLSGGYRVCVFPQELCSRNVLSVWELLIHEENLRNLLWVSLGSSAEGKVLGCPGSKQAVLGVLSSGFGKGSSTQRCSLSAPRGEPRCVCTCSRQLQFLWGPCEEPELC